MTASTSVAVDTINGVIRGVSVITGGIVARGHDLEVDGTTVRQLFECASRRGQVPVRVDHQSGAAAVCGYLTNFRVEGHRLLGDWHLLQSHPQRDQILEVAQRMPGCLGLSASFIGPKIAERSASGRNAARCVELLSVDYVAQPAANPTGLFHRHVLNGQVIDFAVGTAVAAGAASGVRTMAETIKNAGGLRFRRPVTVKRVLKSNSPLLRRALINGGIDAALVGGAVYGVTKIQQRQDEEAEHRAAMRARRGRREFARPAVHRVIDATRDNLPEYEAPAEVGAVKRVLRTPLAQRIIARAGKVGVGAAAGAVLGHKLLRRAKAGAIAGSTAGFLFDSAPMKNLESLVSRHVDTRPTTAREAHTATSLSARLCLPVHVVHELGARGVLLDHGELFRGHADGPRSYDAADLNAIRHAALTEFAESTAVRTRGTFARVKFEVGQELNKHVRSFAMNDEKLRLSQYLLPAGAAAAGAVAAGALRSQDGRQPSPLNRAASAAGIVTKGAALLGGAAYLRGRLGAGAARAGALGPVKTAVLGGRMLRRDVGSLGRSILERAKAAYRG